MQGHFLTNLEKAYNENLNLRYDNAEFQRRAKEVRSLT